MSTTTTFLCSLFADRQNPSAAKLRVVELGLARDSQHFLFHLYKLFFCILHCKYIITFFTFVVISHLLKWWPWRDHIDIYRHLKTIKNHVGIPNFFQRVTSACENENGKAPDLKYIGNLFLLSTSSSPKANVWWNCLPSGLSLQKSAGDPYEVL